MATSRRVRDGDLLINMVPGSSVGLWSVFRGYHNLKNYVLMADFGLEQHVWEQVSERIFGVRESNPEALAAAIINGTAPGLYVREGDDTSDWETYRQVLARRVEEAMATRRGVGGVGVGETATGAQTTRQQPRQGIGVLSDGREVTVDPVTGHVVPTTATRQDDEIRVGDVVEVVSNTSAYTMASDVGGGGRITRIENSNNVRTSYVDLEPCQGLRLPVRRCAGLPDVRKVTSPSSPQTVAATVSPIPDGEAARIEAAVTDEVRRRSVVDDMRRATSRDFTAAAITDYLQSLGATQIHVNQAPGRLPVVEVAGLSQQAFDTARQNLPVGIQLRAAGGVVGRRVDVPTADANRRPVPATAGVYIGPATPQQPTQPPSRFSLLEVDTDPSADVKAHEPQALKAPVDLAALQAELRAEREAKRALAAAQTPPGRFDLLECDLPAVPASVAVKPAKVPPQRPAVTSPPSKPRNPVETITDLTAARSPLELARMLEGLNDELSTMMRGREAN